MPRHEIALVRLTEVGMVVLLVFISSSGWSHNCPAGGLRMLAGLLYLPQPHTQYCAILGSDHHTISPSHFTPSHHLTITISPSQHLTITFHTISPPHHHHLTISPSHFTPSHHLIISPYHHITISPSHFTLSIWIFLSIKQRVNELGTNKLLKSFPEKYPIYI